MPSNRRSIYRCSDCGADYPEWTGRCESCGAWNTLAEEIVSRRLGRPASSKAVGSARATYQTPIQTISIRHVTELHDRIAA